MSEWISVYKKKPLDGQIVKSRASGKDGFCGRSEFVSKDSTFRTFNDEGNRFVVTIWKHDEWMPITK